MISQEIRGWRMILGNFFGPEDDFRKILGRFSEKNLGDKFAREDDFRMNWSIILG